MALETNQQKLDYLVDKEFKANIFDGVSDREVGARAGFIDAVAKAVLTRNLVYIDPKTGQPSKTRGTNLDTELNWMDIRFYDLRQAVAAVKAQLDTVLQVLANLPVSVLNQSFTTAEGKTTNLAGVLSELDARSGGAVPQVDVNALAAQLAAVLAPAQIKALADQLAKP